MALLHKLYTAVFLNEITDSIQLVHEDVWVDDTPHGKSEVV
jgi:hypothetical protein